MSGNLDEYLWIYVLGIVVGFIMAFGIGANDVANAFATSVGAKSLTLRQAVMIAAVAEFCGAFLMGKHVTDTVRKGIASVDAFEDNPDLLMLGMFCALFGAGLWLLIATRLALPVSTTHSIIGGIVGFSLVAHGSDGVKWDKFAGVVASWISSPFIAAFIGFCGYYATRQFILRKEDSTERGFKFFPVFVFALLFINSMFVVYKGSPRLGLKSTPLWLAIVVSMAIGIGGALIIQLVALPRLRRFVEERQEKRDLEAQGESSDSDVQAGTEMQIISKPVDAATNGEIMNGNGHVAKDVPAMNGSLKVASSGEKPRSAKGYMSSAIAAMDSRGEQIHGNLGVREQTMHDSAEKFSPASEDLFHGLQVVTATFDSFAHGANDVANAIGPLAAIAAIYDCSCADSKADVPLWILALGGVGIVIGLATYGYHVIRSIGVRLVKVTPSRGFTIELASAITVIVSSRLGIPVSTTHCQVGATVGVGVTEGMDHLKTSVNWGLFLNVFLSWIVTVVFAGGVSAALYAFATHAPCA